MDDGRMLTMQIADGIHDRTHDGQNLSEWKTFIWLSLSQHLQVWPLNIVHEHIRSIMYVILEHTIYARQGRVVEPSKDFAFKGKSITITFIWVNHFVEIK